MRALVRVEMPLVHVLQSMETVGIAVDPAASQSTRCAVTSCTRYASHAFFCALLLYNCSPSWRSCRGVCKPSECLGDGISRKECVQGVRCANPPAICSPQQYMHAASRALTAARLQTPARQGLIVLHGLAECAAWCSRP